MRKRKKESVYFFFFQAEDGIRDGRVTGVQTCALPISMTSSPSTARRRRSSQSANTSSRRWRSHPTGARAGRRTPRAARADRFLSSSQMAQSEALTYPWTVPAIRFPIRIGRRSRPYLRLWTVRPDTAFAELDDDVDVHFGRFTIRTPVANLASWRIEGPFLWITAIGI